MTICFLDSEESCKGLCNLLFHKALHVDFRRYISLPPDPAGGPRVSGGAGRPGAAGRPGDLHQRAGGAGPDGGAGTDPLQGGAIGLTLRCALETFGPRNR